jgi:hypothetical protein
MIKEARKPIATTLTDSQALELARDIKSALRNPWTNKPDYSGLVMPSRLNKADVALVIRHMVALGSKV